RCGGAVQDAGLAAVAVEQAHHGCAAVLGLDTQRDRLLDGELPGPQAHEVPASDDPPGGRSRRGLGAEDRERIVVLVARSLLRQDRAPVLGIEAQELLERLPCLGPSRARGPDLERGTALGPPLDRHPEWWRDDGG